MTWNEEQLDFIARPLGHGVLMGIPGGGKTRSIIGRIKAQVAQCVIPADGFIILTFSRIACKDFIRKGDDEMFNARNVRTLHSLAGYVMSRCASAGSNCMIQTVVSRATRVVQSDPTVADLDVLRNVKSIIVDEAQDISATQYAFVMAVAARLGASVVMVGDPNQSIYGFQGGDPRFLREHPGWRVDLRVNYRSSQGIVDVVNACRPWQCDAPMLSTNACTGRPELHCASENDILTHLVSALSGPDALRSCAIVAPTKRSYDKSGVMKNVGVQLAANVLHQNNIPFEIHYDETKESSERTRQDNIAFKPGRVHLLTIHGSKGLEFDDVYVLNFHHWTYGYRPDEEDEKTFRYMWYVAVSRARTRLTCYCWAPRSAWPVQALTELFDVHGELKIVKSKPAKKRTDPTVAWTELLNDRVALSEEKLCVLESSLLDRVTLDPYPGSDIDVTSVRLPEFAHVASLYGNWAEAWFETCCNRSVPTCLRTVAVMAEACVTVYGELAATAFLVRRALGKSLSSPFTLEEILSADSEELRAECHRKGRDLQKELGAHVRDTLPEGTVQFHIHCTNRCQWFNTGKLREMLAEWRSRELTYADIWRIAFFLWQYDCEARYRFVGNMPKRCAVIRSLKTHAECIRQWAELMGPGWTFQVPCRWEAIPREPTIVGVIDAINVRERSVLELKFSPGGMQPMHAMQVAGYAHMRNQMADIDSDWKLLVWNLYDGSRHSVHTSFPTGADVANALSTPLHGATAPTSIED